MESYKIPRQHLPVQIDPTIFSFGSFQLRYYSLMYLVVRCRLFSDSLPD